MTLTLYMPAFSSVRLIACSPPSWMIQLALHEKDLEHRVVELDFAAGEHRTPEMLARNPRGTIPVLTEGSRTLYETFAILEYLEAAYPHPALMPEDLDARAIALTCFHASSNLKTTGMQLFAYLMRNPEPDPARLDDMKARLHAELAHWERHLTSLASPFLAGDALTLADLSVYAYLATAQYLGLSLSPESALAAFVERMRARQSVNHTWPVLWRESTLTLLS